MTSRKEAPSILIFGEVLWDIFSSEEKSIEKIGGAPFNLAAHAARLGARALLVSAVGDDVLGERAQNELEISGVNTVYVTKNSKPTGFCSVTLENGSPSYALADDTAYDYIDTDPIRGDFDALYFGTLALRGEHNQKSLKKLFKSCSFGDVFFDVNIRQGFSPSALIGECLKDTTILKISREEAHFLGYGDIPLEELCEKLSLKYKNLRLILVTLDKDGAFAFDCLTQKFYQSQKPKNVLVSAVGAGDSFSACFLCNIKSGADIRTSLSRAVTLSDFVVTKLEAVPDYNEGLLEKVAPW